MTEPIKKKIIHIRYRNKAEWGREGGNKRVHRFIKVIFYFFFRFHPYITTKAKSGGWHEEDRLIT